MHHCAALELLGWLWSKSNDLIYNHRGRRKTSWIDSSTRTPTRSMPRAHLQSRRYIWAMGTVGICPNQFFHKEGASLGSVCRWKVLPLFYYIDWFAWRYWSQLILKRFRRACSDCMKRIIGFELRLFCHLMRKTPFALLDLTNIWKLKDSFQKLKQLAWQFDAQFPISNLDWIFFKRVESLLIFPGKSIN